MNSENIYPSADLPTSRKWPKNSLPYAKAWGYDRLRIVIDQPTLPGPVNRLRRACGGGLEVRPGRMPYNPVWQCAVDMYQPSLRALEILNEICLGSRVGAMLTYAEIAHDLIFSHHAAATAYESLLLERLVMRYQRDVVKRHISTSYFNDRSDASASKRGRVVASYSDKPTKLPTRHAGQPCAHIECRITGSAKLGAVGLASVGDLRDFDFGSFWQSLASLYELPAKTELGQLIGGPGGDTVSGTALRKRGQKFLHESSIDGQFYMHNAVRQEPGLLRKLLKLPNDILHFPEAAAARHPD